MNQEHKKRIIAALLGLVVLFGIYFFFRHWGLVFITVVISWAAYLEFLAFSGASKSLQITSSLVGLFLAIWLGLELPGALLAIYISSLAIILRCLWQSHRSAPENIGANFQFAQSRLLGLVYLVFFPSFIPKIHSMPNGASLLLLLLLVVWLGDTAAYYAGKKWGKRKLSLNVSPGKTLEGALASLTICTVLGIAFSFFRMGHWEPWKLPLLTVSTSVIAQAGDLVESLMKRAYQVKDSGGIIPGHGGVFDSFDSLILAAPFFYLVAYFLG